MYSMIRQREEYFKEKEIWFKKGLATPFRKNFFKPAKKTYFCNFYYFAGDQYLLVDGILKIKFDQFPPSKFFLDNPSVIYPNGTKEWYYDNKLHRNNDLPAIEYSNGDKEWWFLGERHRINGPAIIYSRKEYWFKEGCFQQYSLFYKIFLRICCFLKRFREVVQCTLLLKTKEQICQEN